MDNLKLFDGEMAQWMGSTDYKGPLGLTVKLYIQEDQVDAFLEIMRQMIATTVAEKGCNKYLLNEDYKDASIFWLTEEWASVENLGNHLNQPLFKEKMGQITPMLREPRVLAACYKDCVSQK
eukprot:TCONS_00069339-protein